MTNIMTSVLWNRTGNLVAGQDLGIINGSGCGERFAE
jgi:hypothetical protein